MATKSGILAAYRKELQSYAWAAEAAPRLVRDYINRKGMRAFTWEG